MQIELRLYPVPASSRWPFSLVHSEELGNSKNFNETLALVLQSLFNSHPWMCFIHSEELGNSKNFNETLALVLQSLFNSHPWMCFMKGEDSQTKVMEKVGYLGYPRKSAQESGSQSPAWILL